MIIRKTKKIKFARVGGLSAVVQKGYAAQAEAFHSPPARKGIYAFVHPYIEKFLLSGRPVFDRHGKLQWTKDKHGERVPLTESTGEPGNKIWVMEDKLQSTFFLAQLKPLKVFDYEGLVWHHLGRNLRPDQILKRKDSWVLSTTQDHREAFFKELHVMNQFLQKEHQTKIPGDKSWVGFRFSWDHLEVFIEKI